MQVYVVNVDQNASVEIPDAQSLYDAVAQSVAAFRAHRREIVLRPTDTLWVCTHERGIGYVTVATAIAWAEAHRGTDVAERLLAELR